MKFSAAWGVLWRELSFFYAVLHGTDDEVRARMPIEISIRQCYCVLICGHMVPIPLVQQCTRPGMISAGAMGGGPLPGLSTRLSLGVLGGGLLGPAAPQTRSGAMAPLLHLVPARSTGLVWYGGTWWCSSTTMSP